MKFQLTLLSGAIAAVLSAGAAAASDRELDVAMDVVDSVDGAHTFEMPLGGDHAGDVTTGHHEGDVGHHGDGAVGVDRDGIDVVTGDHHGSDGMTGDHQGGDVAMGDGDDDVAGIDDHDADVNDDNQHDEDDADVAATGQVSDIHEGHGDGDNQGGNTGGDSPGTGDGMAGTTGDGMGGTHTTGGATDGMHSTHRI